MSSANRDRTEVIAHAIDRYVATHARAADTVDGVRSWWIGAAHFAASLEDVQKALDHLVAQGRLQETALPSGVRIYSGRAAERH